MGPKPMRTSSDAHSPANPQGNAPPDGGPFGGGQQLPEADQRTGMEQDKEGNVAPNNGSVELFLQNFGIF